MDVIRVVIHVHKANLEVKVPKDHLDLPEIQAETALPAVLATLEVRAHLAQREPLDGLVEMGKLAERVGQGMLQSLLQQIGYSKCFYDVVDISKVKHGYNEAAIPLR